MDFQQAFKMAMKSLMTSKVRSLLTMLGIIIGVAAVIAIISIGNGMINMMTESFADMGTNVITVNISGRGSSRSVDVDDMYQLVTDNPELLSAVSPVVNAMGVSVKHGTTEFSSTSVTGVAETYPDVQKAEIAQGRFLQYIDIARQQKVCVIGSYIAQMLQYDGGDTNTIKINGQNYSVVGILAEKDDSSEGSSDDVIYIPYTNAAKLSWNSSISQYYYCSTSETTAAAAVTVIETMLYGLFASDDYYSVVSMSEMLDTITELQNSMIMVIAAIAGISLVVGGIGIMNIMLVSVTERTREIGIRKSLGARRSDIRRQFIIEAASTSAIGGLIGIVLGTILGYAGGILLDFTITPAYGAMLVAFGVSAGIGIIFGYLPANKAAKLNPIDALRYD